ncbi:Flp pilus assembly complex ATPase component TadA [Vibrio fluvialis]|nr:Flp pilus assembly complex ATPase component TadA [Vibrio fluvialis]MBY7902397.1 Flp pilus assembly complex ATPase component TadA [Vibrio fluvialis]
MSAIASKSEKKPQLAVVVSTPSQTATIESVADLGEIEAVYRADTVGQPKSNNEYGVLVFKRINTSTSIAPMILISESAKQHNPDTVHALIKLFRSEATQRVSANPQIVTVPKDLILNLLKNSSTASESSEVVNARDNEIERLLLAAHNLNASDIHISASETNGFENFIKLRVNGELQYYGTPERAHAEVFSMFSVLYSKMAAKDGSIDGKEFDAMKKSDAVMYRDINNMKLGVRIASHNTSGKGKDFYVVMRVLGDQNVFAKYKPLGEVGFLFNQIEHFGNSINGKGLILVIGETNSGKSATIQNTLIHIARTSKGTKSIYSLENPIEKQIRGVQQFNISATGSQTKEDLEKKAAGLQQFFMRADPDVINIAEIRDQMTASASLQAALTGHNILASLHCDSPFDVPERYKSLDKTIELMRIAGTIKIVVSQMLLPELCPQCSYNIGNVPKLDGDQETAIEDVCAAGLGQHVDELRFRNTSGRLEIEKGVFVECSNPKCVHGLVDRKLVAEVVQYTPEIVELIAQNKKYEAKLRWLKKGNYTKLDCALYRAFRGQVDIGSIRAEFGKVTKSYEERERNGIPNPRSIYD